MEQQQQQQQHQQQQQQQLLPCETCHGTGFANFPQPRKRSRSRTPPSDQSAPPGPTQHSQQPLSLYQAAYQHKRNNSSTRNNINNNDIPLSRDSYPAASSRYAVAGLGSALSPGASSVSTSPRLASSREDESNNVRAHTLAAASPSAASSSQYNLHLQSQSRPSNRRLSDHERYRLSTFEHPQNYHHRVASSTSSANDKPEYHYPTESRLYERYPSPSAHSNPSESTAPLFFKTESRNSPSLVGSSSGKPKLPPIQKILDDIDDWPSTTTMAAAAAVSQSRSEPYSTNRLGSPNSKATASASAVRRTSPAPHDEASRSAPSLLATSPRQIAVFRTAVSNSPALNETEWHQYQYPAHPRYRSYQSEQASQVQSHESAYREIDGAQSAPVGYTEPHSLQDSRRLSRGQSHHHPRMPATSSSFSSTTAPALESTDIASPIFAVPAPASASGSLQSRQSTYTSSLVDDTSRSPANKKPRAISARTQMDALTLEQLNTPAQDAAYQAHSSTRALNTLDNLHHAAVDHQSLPPYPNNLPSDVNRQYVLHRSLGGEVSYAPTSSSAASDSQMYHHYQPSRTYEPALLHDRENGSSSSMRASPSLEDRGAELEAAIHLATIASVATDHSLDRHRAYMTTGSILGDAAARVLRAEGSASDQSSLSTAPSLITEESTGPDTMSIAPDGSGRPVRSPLDTSVSASPDELIPASPALSASMMDSQNDPDEGTSSSGTGKYSCEVCRKKFTRPSALAVHSHMHTGAKPFGCVICFRSFSVNSNLRRHMKTHSREERTAIGQ